jgi:hypothetical protein
MIPIREIEGCAGRMIAQKNCIGWTLERKGKRQGKLLEALDPGCHDLYLFHLIMMRAESVFLLL